MIKTYKELILLFILSFALGLLLLHINPILPVEGDQFSYAIISKNIVDYGTISSSSSIPATIYTHGGIPEFEINQPLFYSFIQAAVFFVFEPSDFYVSLTSIIFFSLLAPLTYLVSLHLFDRQVARISSILVVTSGVFFHYAISGLTETFYTVIFLLLILSIIGGKRAYIIGALVGIMYLTRSSTLFYIPALFYIVLIFYKGEKINLIRILTGIALVVMPIVIRNFILYDTSYALNTNMTHIAFSHNKLDFYEGFRSIQFPINWSDPKGFILNNLKFYYTQYFLNVFKYIATIPSPFYLFFGAFIFLNFIFNGNIGINQKIYKYFLVLVVSLSIVGFSIGGHVSRYLVPIYPFLIIATVYQSIVIIKKKSLKYKTKKLIVYLFIFTMFSPAGVYFYRLNNSNVIDYSFLTPIISSNYSSKSIIVTDIPVTVSWYGEVKSIFFPNKIIDIERLDRLVNGEIDGIVISKRVHNRSLNNSANKDWIELFENPPNSILNNYELIYKDEKVVLFKKK